MKFKAFWIPSLFSCHPYIIYNYIICSFPTMYHQNFPKHSLKWVLMTESSNNENTQCFLAISFCKTEIAFQCVLRLSWIPSQKNLCINFCQGKFFKNEITMSEFIFHIWFNSLITITTIEKINVGKTTIGSM